MSARTIVVALARKIWSGILAVALVATIGGYCWLVSSGGEHRPVASADCSP